MGPVTLSGPNVGHSEGEDSVANTQASAADHIAGVQASWRREGAVGPARAGVVCMMAISSPAVHLDSVHQAAELGAGSEVARNCR